jgi:phenylalanyl-tRNA synthetase beta chain
MRFPPSWIREYVKVPADDTALAAAFTLSGSEVEERLKVEGETVFDFGITVNRPDCMNVLGLAREASALFGAPLNPPGISYHAPTAESSVSGRVSVESPELCPRYRALLLTGVKPGPSPAWIQKRLVECGQRPINAVVDITNYVLLELGHPLHAFDLDRLAGQKIVVRTAREGESLAMLDGESRELPAGTLVIADAKAPVAVAGVMGGVETGVTFSTRNILLEGAVFDPISIRRTARRLGLHTEASHRFERGVDFHGPVMALDRAASLILENCGGEAAKEVTDVTARTPSQPRITLKGKTLNSVGGFHLPFERAAAILKSLGFSAVPEGEDALEVGVPSFRVDVSREIDLVEEVLRIHGMDAVPSRRPQVVDPVGGRPPALQLEEAARDILSASGFSETIHLTMTDPELEEAAALGGPPVPLDNPMSETASILRATLAGSLLSCAVKNRDRGTQEMSLFEIGFAFSAGSGEGKSIVQSRRLALLDFVDDPPTSLHGNKPHGLLRLKGTLEVLAERLGICGLSFKKENAPAFAEGQGLAVLIDGKPIGSAGAISGRLLGRLSLRGHAFVSEIRLDGLEGARKIPRFKPFSRFPSVVRDFSFVVDDHVEWEKIRNLFENLSLPHLVSVNLVDLYKGESVPQGKTSWTVSLVFRSEERTLEEKDLDSIPGRVEGALASEIGATLR